MTRYTSTMRQTAAHLLDIIASDADPFHYVSRAANGLALPETRANALAIDLAIRARLHVSRLGVYRCERRIAAEAAQLIREGWSP